MSESCRRSMRCCGGGARRWGSQRLAGARDLPEAAQGETGSFGAAERQKTLATRTASGCALRADGRRLRAGPRGAGEAGLCGQRAQHVVGNQLVILHAVAILKEVFVQLGILTQENANRITRI